MTQEKAAASKKLSKAVLELKFMKKSKEKAMVQEENEERQQLYQDQLSSLHEGAEKIVMVSSYVECLKFLPCRLSFGGMDPDVEKLNEDRLMGLYAVTKPTPKEAVTQMDADISAQEMAARYRPANQKSTPGYVKEEEEEGVEESKPDADSTPHNRPNKSSLRAIFRGGTEGDRGGGGERRGAHRGGRGGNLRGGGRGGNFRGGRRGNFRGKKGDGQKGRRGGMVGDFREGRRGSKGVNLTVKAEYPRDQEQAPTREDLGDGRTKMHQKNARWGGKRSYEGSHRQQQGRDSPGHNQSHQYNDGHQHKKIKAEPN